jgi:ubiquinone/menaquinone biosynthesis C-methylase UbiE
MKAQNSTEWFGDWANEYDNTLGKVKRHHKLLGAVVSKAKVKDGEHILDIGCGTGLLTLKFLQKANCRVTGVDNSSAMLDLFRNKTEKLKLTDMIECRQADAAKLPFEKNSFDICASTVTLHHLKSKLGALKTIHRILKPGGRFVLGDLDVDTTGPLKDPSRMLRILGFLKEEFALALKEGGVQAFSRMYDNGKKHILNDGEYCISFAQWADLCQKAGFRNIQVASIRGFEWFKVLKADKD